MKILITGGSGQLGTELKGLLTEKNIEFVSTDKDEMDITNQTSVKECIGKIQPDYVFHCAAYTAVDKAEEEGKELNELINVQGTQNVVEAIKGTQTKLVYISTDYVFDGTKKEGEYQVDDLVHPLNEYGRTKYEGEVIVAENLKEYYIIRTSWVFGEFGHNFVYTMKNLAKTHKKLTVVNDQYGRPTWTRSLAEFMVYLVEKQGEYGMYHFSNENSCTWYEFAKEILKDEDVEVLPVTSNEYPQKATRPQYSIMSLDKVRATGFNNITWQEALEKMLKNIEKQ